MSKPKLTNSSSKQLINVSITSPKGSLIAEINNLRKQLKDYKQLKKQSSLVINNQRPTKDNQHNVFNNTHSQMKSPLQQQYLSKTQKQKFFKSPTSKSNNIKYDDHKNCSTSNKKSNPNNNNISRNLFIKQEQQKSVHKFNNDPSYYQKQHNEDKKGQSVQIVQKHQQQLKKKQNTYTKQQKQPQQFQLQSIIIKEKDRKLKLDIQLNKLRKIITKLGPQQITQQLNHIIKLINFTLKQYTTRIQRLQLSSQYDQTNSDQLLLIKRQQQQISQLTFRIQSLEQQNTQLTKQLSQLKSFTNQQQQNQTNQQQQQSQQQQLTQQYRNKLQLLQHSLLSYEQKAIQLQQQNRILSIKLLKKQQHLLLTDEDVNYLRIQTQNYKQQKNQFNQLYQSLMSEYRQYKRTKTLQIQGLQIQKQKWEKQCKSRRVENETIKQLQQQKLLILKQLQQMRMLVNLKSTQLQQKKQMFYQNQKKVIMLQSQVYKLKGEVVKERNDKEFVEFQCERLREEIQSIKKYGVVRGSSINDNNISNSSNIKNNNNNSNSISRSKSRQRAATSPLQPSTPINNTINKLYQPLHQHQQQTPLLTQQQQQHFQHNPNATMQIDNAYHNHHFPIQQQHNKLSHFNKKLKDKEQKLKALDDIHSLIKKHKNSIVQN